MGLFYMGKTSQRGYSESGLPFRFDLGTFEAHLVQGDGWWAHAHLNMKGGSIGFLLHLSQKGGIIQGVDRILAEPFGVEDATNPDPSLFGYFTDLRGTVPQEMFLELQKMAELEFYLQ